MSRSLCLFALFSILLTVKTGNAALRVVMFDVGMGQSVLLVENNRGILIDTGLPAYTDHISQRMAERGVEKLDSLFLSHLHPDHAGGYPQLRETWADTPVFDDCHISPNLHPDERDFFIHTRKKLLNDPLHQCLKAGDGFLWQGHTITVLWPGERQSPTDLNAHSLVLLLTTRQGGTLLIMGDVNKTVETELTHVLRPLLGESGVDLYIVNHHGAIDTAASDFLRILQPETALISVGENNPHGYPNEQSLTNLKRFSGAVLRTDHAGEICFETEDDSFVPCL